MRLPIGIVQQQSVGGATLKASINAHGAFWELEEASGTRFDSGSLAFDLSTLTSTPGQSTGKVGNCIDIADGQAISRNTLFEKDLDISSGGGDISAWGWVNVDAFTAANPFMMWHGGDPSTATGMSWAIYFSTSDEIVGRVYQGAGVSDAVATTFGPFSTATWYFVCMRYSVSKELVGISVNGGAFQEVATGATTVNDPANQAYLTHGANNVSAYFDGKIDQSGVMLEEITEDQLALLWNSGAGVSWASLP